VDNNLGFNDFLGDFIQDRVDEYKARQMAEYMEQYNKQEAVYFKEFNQLMLNGCDVGTAQYLSQLRVMNEFDLDTYRIPERIEHDIF
jgi:hypothetical protein